MSIAAETFGNLGYNKTPAWVTKASAGGDVDATVKDARHIQLECTSTITFSESSTNTTGSATVAGFSVLVDGAYVNIVSVSGTGDSIIDIYLYNNIDSSSVVEVEYRVASGDASDATIPTVATEIIDDPGFDVDFASSDWSQALGTNTISAGQLTSTGGFVSQANLSVSTSVLYTLTVEVVSCTDDFAVDPGDGSHTIDVATYGSGGTYTLNFYMASTTETMLINTNGTGATAVIESFSVTAAQPAPESIRQNVKRILANNVITAATGSESVLLPANSTRLKCLIDGSLLNGSGKLYDSSPGGTAVLPNVVGAANQNGVLVEDATLGRYRNQPAQGFWNYATDSLRDSGNEVYEALSSGAWQTLLSSANNELLVMVVGRFTAPDGDTENYDGKMTLRDAGTNYRVALSANGSFHALLSNNVTSAQVTGGTQPGLAEGVDFAMYHRYQYDGATVSTKSRCLRLDGTSIGGSPTKLNNNNIGSGITPPAGIIFEGFTLYGYIIYEFNGVAPSTIDDDIAWMIRKFGQGDIVLPAAWD